MDTNLRNISNKLVSGEKLSTADLCSLEPLHDAIYDNDGRVVGISGSTVGEEVFPLAGEFNLDYVDRSFLDGRHHRQLGQPSERLPRLVRYVGKPTYSESKSNAQFVLCILSTLRFSCFLAFSSNAICSYILESIEIKSQKKAWSKTYSIQNIMNRTTAGDGRTISGTTST